MAEAGSTWKVCSACKKPIAFGALYYVCSVSTCNRKRTGLRFCTVSCWDVHLPIARHRESWAEERTAPSAAGAAATSAAGRAPAERRPAAARGPKRSVASGPAPATTPAAPREVLIVASRLKDYVRAVSGYNTSDRALDPLSDIVRAAIQRAIESARADGRRTVLERDVPRAP